MKPQPMLEAQARSHELIDLKSEVEAICFTYFPTLWLALAPVPLFTQYTHSYTAFSYLTTFACDYRGHVQWRGCLSRTETKCRYMLDGGTFIIEYNHGLDENTLHGAFTTSENNPSRGREVKRSYRGCRGILVSTSIATVQGFA